MPLRGSESIKTFNLKLENVNTKTQIITKNQNSKTQTFKIKTEKSNEKLQSKKLQNRNFQNFQSYCEIKI